MIFIPKPNRYEKVIYQVNNSINEELGISDKVTTLSRQLSSEIINLSKTKSSLPCGIKNVKVKNFNFKHECFGKDLDVFVTVKNFTHKEDYIEYVSKYGNEEFESASSSFGEQKIKTLRKPIRYDMVSVTALSISGTVNKTLLISSLSHELRHIYDQHFTDKSFSLRNDNDLYNYAETLFKNGKTREEREFGLLLYVSFDYERRAIIQDFNDTAENHLPKHDGHMMTEFLRSNKTIETINNIRLLLNKTENGVYDKLIENISMSKQKVIKMFKNAYKDLITRYGKAVIKFKNALRECRINHIPIYHRFELYSEYLI